MDGLAVTVAVVASRVEAELVVGLLRSHGLSARFAADDAGGQEPQLQLQGVRVLVAPSDEALARRLLEAAHETDEAADEADEAIEAKAADAADASHAADETHVANAANEAGGADERGSS